MRHVPEARRAWHAGVSIWAGARDINARSIGIEMVNPGHEFGYRAVPGSADRGADHAVPRHPVAPSHSGLRACWAIATWRRRARTIPANCFRGRGWRKQASACGRTRIAKRSRRRSALARYGYDPDAPLDKVITAFQRHFRPEKLDGNGTANAPACWRLLDK